MSIVRHPLSTGHKMLVNPPLFSFSRTQDFERSTLSSADFKLCLHLVCLQNNLRTTVPCVLVVI